MEVKETLKKILMKELQVCPKRDIPPSQGILPLNPVACLLKNLYQQVSKSQNLADLPGSIQVQSPNRKPNL